MSGLTFRDVTNIRIQIFVFAFANVIELTFVTSLFTYITLTIDNNCIDIHVLIYVRILLNTSDCTHIGHYS